MTEEKYVEMEIDLDVETIEKLDAMAKEMGISRDKVIERALVEFIKENNPEYYDANLKDLHESFGQDTH
jgi:predicted transcriptional regulator